MRDVSREKLGGKMKAMWIRRILGIPMIILVVIYMLTINIIILLIKAIVNCLLDQLFEIYYDIAELINSYKDVWDRSNYE